MFMTKIEKANAAIHGCDILNKLSSYDPIVVSTIMVGLDTEQSDIDIICYSPELLNFKIDFERKFSRYKSYDCTQHNDHVLGTFFYNEFKFEIYACVQETHFQPAFRHYKIMERLVIAGGAELQSAIRALREKGLKTEPAICQYLNIAGDPYEAILEIEHWDDQALEKHLIK